MIIIGVFWVACGLFGYIWMQRLISVWSTHTWDGAIAYLMVIPSIMMGPGMLIPIAFELKDQRDGKYDWFTTDPSVLEKLHENRMWK